MVKLEAIPDEHFTEPQVGQDDDDYYTDTDSSISDTSSTADDQLNETLLERLSALQDIVPPASRRRVATVTSTGWGWLKSGLKFGGNAAWYLSASALFIVVPTALSMVEEAQMMEFEREQKIQQGFGEISAPEPGADVEAAV
ncbi:MAG: mitochondrial import receptor protein [Vezdaea aestivalis]|nr:MAG: mitochondrial import receptor protein [Vezdaea aestivalis]